MPGCGVLSNRLTVVLPGPPNTERPFPNALCALAAEIANPASPEVVRVARANWKNGRFMFDSFHLFHNWSATVGSRECGPTFVPVESDSFLGSGRDGCESRSP